MTGSGLLARAFVLIVLLVYPHVLLAAHPQADSKVSFDNFLASLWEDAQKAGVSRPVFDAAFAGLTPSPSILAHTKQQAEFIKPLWDYLNGAITPSRIERGLQRGKEQAEALQKIQQSYGVDLYIVLAVWGMESNFGAFTGGESVIRALATLAQARYRGDFFRDELLIALQILQQGHIDAPAMKGSWAGAMGQTQFMPSSFIKYAVDFDEDGHKDIWTNVADSLASTANFLAQKGWVKDLPWGMEVRLPKDFDVSATDLQKGESFDQWSSLGLQRSDGEPLPSMGEAYLYLPYGLKGPAFLLTANFKVIKAYNNSNYYALGVGLLSDRLAGSPPLKGQWPKADKQLSRGETIELQQILARKGFDVGEADGRIGDRAQAAIRAYQRQSGLKADGYANPSLLDRLRKNP
ncbi:MAG: lytic murein transglycosylase [Alphaproteobacteria bacterium]|nr:lytic murein transglycosylase [Alphaproteobacteria bacterium]